MDPMDTHGRIMGGSIPGLGKFLCWHSFGTDFYCKRMELVNMWIQWIGLREKITGTHHIAIFIGKIYGFL